MKKTFSQRLEEMMHPRKPLDGEMLVEYRQHAINLIAGLIDLMPEGKKDFPDVILKKIEKSYSDLAEDLYSGVLKGMSVETQTQMTLEILAPIIKYSSVSK